MLSGVCVCPVTVTMASLRTSTCPSFGCSHLVASAVWHVGHVGRAICSHLVVSAVSTRMPPIWLRYIGQTRIATWETERLPNGLKATMGEGKNETDAGHGSKTAQVTGVPD